MKKPLDIVIAGAGVIGLAMAALLSASPRRERLRLTLVDRSEPTAAGDDIGLRVSALSAGSLALLEQLGVRDSIAAGHSCPYRDMRVWDVSSEAFAADALHFAAAEFALPELGCIVADAELRYRLLEVLRRGDTQLRFGSGIAALQEVEGRQRIELEDGSSLHSDLLIGADGGQSAVRRAAGIDVHKWPYDQAAVVTHAQADQAHRYTAWQRFLRNGPLALLPLADGRVSVVWTTRPAHAEELLAASDDEFSAALSEASDRVLGKLRVAAARASFPLRAQHARHYLRRGLVLVGDAAHTVHPLAGQGANLGLADAAGLAEVIDVALARGEHPGDRPVLRRFERRRRGANATMLYFIDGLNRLFAADNPWLSHLRGDGMRLFNRSGPLKQAVVRVALGLENARQP